MWLRGSDLNRRPLGYELPRDRAGNPLISRRMSRSTSNYWFLLDSPTSLSFEDVPGWYGSKMGADDLWVLPKPVRVSSKATRQPPRPRTVALWASNALCGVRTICPIRLRRAQAPPDHDRTDGRHHCSEDEDHLDRGDERPVG